MLMSNLTHPHLTTSPSSAPEEKWALVELVGYQQFAGKVSDEMIDGKPFIRLEVPATQVHHSFECKFEVGSIHCITPLSKTDALTLIKQREVGRFKKLFRFGGRK